MKLISIRRYIDAATAPIVSGLSNVSRVGTRQEMPYISLLIALLISFPFSPAAINLGPSHRISEYVKENAKPDKAKETTRGAPSSLNALKMIPKQQDTNVRRDHASDLESVAFIIDRVVEFAASYRRRSEIDTK